jgi:hypothetical protein
MITDNAPSILFIQLAKGLTESEELELETELAKTPKDLDDAKAIKNKIDELKKKQSAPNNTIGYEGWIPIPLLGTKIIPFLPSNMQATVLKRVETVGNDVVMSGTMSTSTINIKTNSGDLVNSIVNACHLLYAMKDSFARIAFFSPELIVSSGVFLSMSRSISTSTTEQIISIQVQNSTPNAEVKKKLLENKSKKSPFAPVSTEIVGR